MASNLMKKGVSAYGLTLALGTIGGIIVGHTTMRLGRKTAFVMGNGIILYEIARHNGIAKTGWTTITSSLGSYTQSAFKTMSNPTVEGKLKSVAQKNKVLAVGFVGGLLMGVATS